MISKTYIRKNLIRLRSKYDRSRTSWESLIYSKAAILELCGWIETSQDDIIMRASKRLREPANYRFINDEVIGRNSSFKYEKFRGMLIDVVGLLSVEKVEARADARKFTLLKSELNSLNSIRNSLAHTYVKGLTVTIDAPTVTLSRFERVHEGLLELDATLERLI